MIKVVALGLVVLAGTVLAIAATRPDVFRVQRAASIQASPERIYPLIADFQRWGAWSHYEKKDPAMKRSIQSPVYVWEANGEAGVGRVGIVEAAAPSRVRIDMDAMVGKDFEAGLASLKAIAEAK